MEIIGIKIPRERRVNIIIRGITVENDIFLRLEIIGAPTNLKC
jgi:hypothetical protein